MKAAPPTKLSRDDPSPKAKFLGTASQHSTRATPNPGFTSTESNNGGAQPLAAMGSLRRGSSVADGGELNSFVLRRSDDDKVSISGSMLSAIRPASIRGSHRRCMYKSRKKKVVLGKKEAANRLQRWWLHCRIVLKFMRLTLLVRKQMEQEKAERKERAGQAKATLRNFLDHTSGKIRVKKAIESQVKKIELLTVVQSFLRAVQSTSRYTSQLMLKKVSACVVIFQFWKRCQLYAQVQWRRDNGEALFLVCREQQVEAREVVRQERAGFLRMVQHAIRQIDEMMPIGSAAKDMAFRRVTALRLLLNFEQPRKKSPSREEIPQQDGIVHYSPAREEVDSYFSRRTGASAQQRVVKPRDSVNSKVPVGHRGDRHLGIGKGPWGADQGGRGKELDSLSRQIIHVGMSREQLGPGWFFWFHSINFGQLFASGHKNRKSVVDSAVSLTYEVERLLLQEHARRTQLVIRSMSLATGFDRLERATRRRTLSTF